MLTDSLIRIGLTNTEAKIYEVLLNKGPLKTSEILKDAKINSGRIYDILGSLQNKGFISIIDENGIKRFRAAPPSIIEDYLKEQEEKIKERQKEINELLPSLEKIYSLQKEETSVEVYTGYKGMKTAYEILFKEANKNKNLYVTGISKQINYGAWLPLILKTFVYPTRKRLRLKTKKIMNLEAKNEKFWAGDDSELRFLPITALTSYEVLGDVVIIQIIQKEERSTVNLVIKNKQVADDFREQFELLWKIAETKPK